MEIRLSLKTAILFLLSTTPPTTYAKLKDSPTRVVRDEAVGKYALSEVVIEPHGDVNVLRRLSRRDASTKTLQNNAPVSTNISPGDTHVWQFPSSELQKPLLKSRPIVPPWQTELSSSLPKDGTHRELKRQSESKIFVTLNVCGQPGVLGEKPTNPPPPLSLWISLGDDNKMPGPDYNGPNQVHGIDTKGGRAYYEDTKTGDTYLSVSAPKSIDGFSGQWNYQLAISNQDYYTGYFDYHSLRSLDSDLNSTFLVTDALANPALNDTDLAQQWVGTGGPFGVFVYNADDPFFAGINQSFCGLAKYSLAKGNLPGLDTKNSESGMRLYNNSLPYQQIFVGDLNSSASYKAALALPGNFSRDMNAPTVAGGGSIWQSLDLRTRSGDTNCQLIYNLSFCGDVAYSVPTNSSFYGNMTGLAATYDNYTSSELWQKFRNSLDQIPCDTSADAKYSLARNCTDCAEAYKKWLCAVSIPRCADFASSAKFLQPRNTQQQDQQGQQVKWRNGSVPDIVNIPVLANVTNAQSRNMNLSNWINMTGPYKEVLPCDGLCYDLVQSCPSILGFACPWRGRGLEWSYGSIPVENSNPFVVDGYPSCNMPGAIWGVSSSARWSPPWMLISIVLSVTIAFIV